ncbi:hypothetical protein [Chryseobacterium gambrini]|uniref:Uncharacterized protein n=1 Tax=Chryseobacterium gambrini TaxID=373672 RepID=A0ABN7CGB8_9FLAO|nr:hypothetical protein CRDW_28770 [Chryseobacterium gambrini]
MNRNTQNTLIVIIIIGLMIVYKSLYKDETYEEKIEKTGIKSVVFKEVC